MTNCIFTPLLYANYLNKKSGKNITVSPDFDYIESIWMSFYGLGKFELLSFIFIDCKSLSHFQEWIITLKGRDFTAQATLKFNTWYTDRQAENPIVQSHPKTLQSSELKFWEEQGYLRIPHAVDARLCDEVKSQIFKHLDLDIAAPESWYKTHPDWQGIMLQLYQNEYMEKLRQDARVKEIFAELYHTGAIIPNIDKLGYNPPETSGWKNGSSSLHWDLDLSRPVEYYIQGLVYLDEVPEDRGPLQVVPGFHLQFKDWIHQYPDLQQAHEKMRAMVTAQPVPGGKGDLILWQSTLPHSAGINRSALPRFVQYVSFAKL